MTNGRYLLLYYSTLLLNKKIYTSFQQGIFQINLYSKLLHCQLFKTKALHHEIKEYIGLISRLISTLKIHSW